MRCKYLFVMTNANQDVAVSQVVEVGDIELVCLKGGYFEVTVYKVEVSFDMWASIKNGKVNMVEG